MSKIREKEADKEVSNDKKKKDNRKNPFKFLLEKDKIKSENTLKRK